MPFNIGNIDLDSSFEQKPAGVGVETPTQRARFSLKLRINSASRSLNGNGCAPIASIGF
jgi:hypothetical protein